MEYLSTRNNQLRETFTNILFQGLSKDGGLFLPSSWPSINVNTLRDKQYEEVALHIINPFIGGEITEENLYEIISSTYKNFTHPQIAPLVKITNNKYILELFYGPTLAFKDYALQFLGNFFSHVMKESDKKITVLGATSGDTGSAAIDAFKGKNNINVFILHPHNKISKVQRRQMTTVLNDNIFNIAVEGTFDDCQKIVKDLFVDEETQNKTSLTAVNSINWARLIAQTVYYFWAYLQLEEQQVSFIVPSGNFGNIFSARIAKHMGLPIKQLHVVTNQNDILHQIISSGNMIRNMVEQTYSPSMDIQVSSNFERQIFESVKNNSDEVKRIMQDFKINHKYSFNSNILQHIQNIYHSTAVSNETTLETIKIFKQKFNYLADPHTATGLSVLHNIHLDHAIVSLACAHPSKFGDAIKKATDEEPIFPKELENIFDKEEKMSILPNNSDDIKSFILNNI
jgi:threonine synthase